MKTSTQCVRRWHQVHSILYVSFHDQDETRTIASIGRKLTKTPVALGFAVTSLGAGARYMYVYVANKKRCAEIIMVCE